jgi:hypothetical protein
MKESHASSKQVIRNQQPQLLCDACIYMYMYIKHALCILVIQPIYIVNNKAKEKNLKHTNISKIIHPPI